MTWCEHRPDGNRRLRGEPHLHGEDCPAEPVPIVCSFVGIHVPGYSGCVPTTEPVERHYRLAHGGHEGKALLCQPCADALDAGVLAEVVRPR